MSKEITQEQAERVAARLRDQGYGSKVHNGSHVTPGAWALEIRTDSGAGQTVLLHATKWRQVDAALVDALRAEGILPPPAGMVMIPREDAEYHLRALRHVKAISEWARQGITELELEVTSQEEFDELIEVEERLAAVLGEEPKGTEEEAG